MTFPFPYVIRDSSLLFINNPGVEYATDFRNHQNTDDFSSIRASDSGILSIVNEGVISEKCLQITDNTDTLNGMYYQWLLSDAVASDDQEVLGLVEFNGTKTTSGATALATIGLKYQTTDKRISMGLGRNNTTDVGISVGFNTAFGGFVTSRAWTIGNRYWVRSRIQTTRNFLLRIWDYGDAEPGTWLHSDFFTSDRWPSTAGRAGVDFVNTPSGQTMRLHYLSVAYSGGTAPSP
jgi:hypothetical protein